MLGQSAGGTVIRLRLTHRAAIAGLLLVLAFAAAGQEPPVVRVNPESFAEGRLSLTGAWRFHSGDEASWADPDLDDNAWPLSATGFERGRMPTGGWSGIGWFRLHLQVDEEMRGEPLALIVFQEGASEIYLDGEPIARLGRVAGRADDEEVIRQVEVTPISLSLPRHVLAIRHSNFLVPELHRFGLDPGFHVRLAEPKAAEDSDFRNRRPTVAQVEQVLFTSVPLVFTVLHLLFFLFDRHARENLYFALVTLSFSAAAFFDYQLSFEGPLAQISQVAMWQRIAITLLPLSCLRFVYALLEDRLPRQYWGFVAAVGLIWTRMVFTASDWQTAMNILMFLFVCTIILEFLRTAPIFLRQRRDGTWILNAGVLTLFLGGLLDQLMDLGLVGAPIFGTYNPYLYGGLVMLFSMSVYLARSFARTQRELQRQLVQVRELSEKTLVQERAAREQEIERRILDADHARKTAELEEARLLQLSLLPTDLPAIDGYDIAAAMRTATEVGGDYYDFEVRGSGELLVAIGDAVGHGARAGTLVAATKSLFKALAGGGEPVAILTRFNAAIRGMRMRRAHMALSLALFTNGRLRLAAAGMPPVLILRAANGEVEEVAVEGLPLGSSGRFPYRQQSVELATGDTVLLLSDGFPELRDDSDEELGYPRVQSLLREARADSASDVVQSLEKTVEAWTGGQSPGDDVTFVVVKVRA